MYYAVDAEGKRVSIDDAKQSQTYYCPICGEPLIQKRGTIKEYHFAHKSSSLCDQWHYDMSEWHRTWQLLFPPDTREVVVECNGIKHRADVLVSDTVIEFQHSRLSNSEFWERNRFYNAAGYEVLWIFDFFDVCDNEQVVRKEDDDSMFCWKYPWHTFDGFVPREERDIQVFLQLDVDSDDYGCIEHVVWFSPNRKRFITEYGESYNRADIVRIYCSQNKEDSFSVADLRDDLPESRVEADWQVRCPLNNGKWKTVDACICCEYSTSCSSPTSIGKPFEKQYNRCDPRIDARYHVGCLYRFRNILNDWNLKDDTVNDISFDQNDNIVQVDITKNGKEETVHIEKASLKGETLLELLRSTDAHVIGASNIYSGIKVKVGNSGYFHRDDVSGVRGYLGKPHKHEYYSDRRDIYGWNRPEWVIEWEI